MCLNQDWNTLSNGSEFTQNKTLSQKLNLDFHLANPYSS